MPTTSPTSLTELLRTIVDCKLSDTYHMLPGIVQTYYSATEDADIQIAVNDPRFAPEDDTLSTEPWPVYPHMRVAWPTFGGFIIRGPISAGDKVQVYFQDLDDSQFRTTGQQSDPARTRRFGSDNAFCVPWSLTDAGVATEAALPGLTLGKEGGQPQIRITGATIQLGATGGDFVALASLVNENTTLMKALAAALTAYTAAAAAAWATVTIASTAAGGPWLTAGVPAAAGAVASTAPAVASTGMSVASGTVPVGSTLVAAQ